MRAFLASPLGFLIGLSLGALGGGGSVLAVPALVYAAGQDPRAAITTSLILVGAASLVGMARHHQAGRVRLGTGAVVGVAGIGGSLMGSALNRGLDTDILLLGFAGLVGVAAWRMLAGRTKGSDFGDPSSANASTGATGSTKASKLLRVGFKVDITAVVTVVVSGSAIGFLTGLFGVGGGFVIVPVLVLGLRIPMPEAVGTSLFIIVINTAVALAARLATTDIDWGVTLPFTIAAIGGVIAGSHLAARLEPDRSRRWFAVLLIAVALYTAGQAGSALL